MEEKTWLPVPQSNQESLMLRADTCIFPSRFNPYKEMGFFSMFLIKLKSVTLCFPMTDPCGFPPEMEESGTW